MPMTPAEFGKLLADETEKWGKVIRAANIKPGRSFVLPAHAADGAVAARRLRALWCGMTPLFVTSSRHSQGEI